MLDTVLDLLESGLVVEKGERTGSLGYCAVQSLLLLPRVYLDLHRRTAVDGLADRILHACRLGIRTLPRGSHHGVVFDLTGSDGDAASNANGKESAPAAEAAASTSTSSATACSGGAAASAASMAALPSNSVPSLEAVAAAPPPIIEVATKDKGVDVDGRYALATALRNGAPCYTRTHVWAEDVKRYQPLVKEDSPGAIYYQPDGADVVDPFARAASSASSSSAPSGYWRLCQDGCGPTAVGLNFSQRPTEGAPLQRGPPLGAWRHERSLIGPFFAHRLYDGLMLSEPLGVFDSSPKPIRSDPSSTAASSIRVDSTDAGVQCSGIFVLQSQRRNGAACYTRDTGSGALYYDGSYWKLCQNGSGERESGWNFSQRGRPDELPLGAWERSLRQPGENERDYSKLTLESPSGGASDSKTPDGVPNLKEVDAVHIKTLTRTVLDTLTCV